MLMLFVDMVEVNYLPITHGGSLSKDGGDDCLDTSFKRALETDPSVKRIIRYLHLLRWLNTFGAEAYSVFGATHNNT